VFILVELQALRSYKVVTPILPLDLAIGHCDLRFGDRAQGMRAGREIGMLGIGSLGICRDLGAVLYRFRLARGRAACQVLFSDSTFE